MNLLDAISAFLIALAAIDVVSTVVLVRAAFRTRENALTERAAVSVFLTAFALGVALLALNRLADLHLPNEIAAAILVAGLVMISAPQVMWLIAYQRRNFR